MPEQDIGGEFLADALRNFRSYKKLAEDALAQVEDEEIFRLIDRKQTALQSSSGTWRATCVPAGRTF